MRKLTYIALLSLFWLTSAKCYAANSGQVEVVQLIKPEDIRDATAMSEAIDGVSNKVMECVQGKLAPASECFCLYPKELSRIRTIYENTIKQHPNWKDKAVSYMQEGRSVTLSLGGVSRQLERKCQPGKEQRHT